jgi:hypothetical protein
MPQKSSSLYRGLKTSAASAFEGIHLLARICRSNRAFPPRPCPSSLSPVRLLLSLCLLAFSCKASQAQAAPAVSSFDVEAAYLYNFGKFIEWPAPPDATAAPFSICVVGKDEFGATLDSLIQNETVNGRAIVVKRLPTVTDADACQILFLGSTEEARLARDLDTVKAKPILTVSSIPGFLDHGGMIQFLVGDNRVRFAVNLAPATRAHLTLSSELLKVAVYVNSKPAQGGQ